MKNFNFSKIDQLPDHIMLLIFDYCSGYDLTTSFQRVCTRWKYLINKYESIWRGDVKLKGITEQQCKNKLCDILKRTPKLKYLQIGNPRNSILHTINDGGNGFDEEETNERTENVLRTIEVYNKELEYLHVIDRYPLCDSIHSIIGKTQFKRLKITLDKLCDRREKIEDLKMVFSNLPDVDNMCIDFCQRIQFHCKKENLEWDISQDFETDNIDEFV